MCGCLAKKRRKGVLIGLLVRNNSAHSPLWGWDIANIAGNQVDMNVKDTLPRRLTDIDADVVTIRMETLSDHLFNTA